MAQRPWPGKRTDRRSGSNDPAGPSDPPPLKGMMESQAIAKTALDDDDRLFIAEAFSQAVVPKLRRLHARLGTLNCDFAGPEYRNWSIQFRSVGPDFEIVDFEYDETGTGLDLDL